MEVWHRLAAAALVSASAAALAAEPSPRIVNGSPTFEHPSVGALLRESEEEPERFGGICTGTLIGCHTFVVAAHCVCPEETEDAAGCLAAGTTDPALLRVFLPHAGLLAVESVAIHPAYVFAVRGDAAVLRLAVPASGVQPSAINTQERPPLGTRGTIVGFGSTGGPPFLPSDYGVKRDGRVSTTSCIDDIPNATHVCWQYLGDDASTCSGDSGGPLFVDLGAGPLLAGIVSGGESFACFPPDQVFSTDVFVHRAAILAELADDTTSACGGMPAVGEAGVERTGAGAELTESEPELRLEVTVPPHVRRLRLALNGQQVSGRGFQSVANDFDLYLRFGSAPTEEEFDCADQSVGTFGFCDIADPAPGVWHALATAVEGVGRIQLVATIFNAALLGDGNCDDRIGAADLPALAALIGEDRTDPCDRADANRDGRRDAADVAPTVAAIFGGG